MSQHDYVLADQAGLAFLSDLNDALAAVVSLNSGATAPATTYAYQYWLDTTAGLLKQRNAANSGWVVRATAAEVFTLSRSSNTILGEGDRSKVLIATGSYTQTLTAAATLGDGWFIDIIVDSGATLTLDPNSTETVDGSATKAIVGPAQGRLVCNGTLFRTLGFGSASDWVLGTAVATTSGTTKDFTGLPPNVAELIVMLYNVSTGGSSNYLVQIGTSGGMANSGYSSQAWQGGSGDTLATSSAGFLASASAAAARNYNGALRLTRFSGNKWVASGVVTRDDGAGFACAGIKELSAELTQLRFTTVSADTFDAGEVNILYRVA
jgi:hypothetical protein